MIPSEVFGFCSRLQSLSLINYDKIGPICINSDSLKTLDIEFLFRNNIKKNIDTICMLQLNTPNVDDLFIGHGFNLEIHGTIGQKIKKLGLHYGQNITLHFAFPNVEDLGISGTATQNYKLSNINLLTNLSHLKSLSLISVDFQCSMGPLLKMSKLTHLSLCNSSWYRDISCNFSLLINLETLKLSNTQVCDISSLTALTRLRELKLTHCKKITDFSPLFHCGSLENIWLLYSNMPYDQRLDLDLQIARRMSKKNQA
jgi:Leucine-rich repeat (LRR) protein